MQDLRIDVPELEPDPVLLARLGQLSASSVPHRSEGPVRALVAAVTVLVLAVFSWLTGALPGVARFGGPGAGPGARGAGSVAGLLPLAARPPPGRRVAFRRRARPSPGPLARLEAPPGLGLGARRGKRAAEPARRAATRPDPDP